MTREKAIEEIKNYNYNYPSGLSKECRDYIIKALEQEPFINKPCVSSGVCEHDKNKVLDKIRTEIESIDLLAEYTRGDIKRMTLATIDKYKVEGEDKE